MALPIKETPVLTGKDADEFRKRMENPGSVSKEDYERAKKVHDEIEERRIKDAFNAILKCDLRPETIICSDCGNGICEDIETLCGCFEDCEGIKKPMYENVEEFCEGGYFEHCEMPMNYPHQFSGDINLEHCSLCE